MCAPEARVFATLAFGSGVNTQRASTAPFKPSRRNILFCPPLFQVLSLLSSQNGEDRDYIETLSKPRQLTAGRPCCSPEPEARGDSR